MHAQHTHSLTRSSAPLHKQRGVASLLVSLVILTVITAITLYTAKNMLTEQKLSNNDYRARQAFEAAEAGLNAAIQYLDNGRNRNADTCADPNNPVDTEPCMTVDGTSDADPIFDSNGDGTADTNTLTVGQTQATVEVTELNGGLTLRIRSEGVSDDNTAKRVVTQDIVALNPFPNLPDNPLTTRGQLAVNGSATVYNPEGHSTIWSGNGVELGSNNATATEVADVTDPGYPSCMDTPMTCNTIPSSNKVTIGLDVIENDSSLAALTDDEFFENFFGYNPTTYLADYVTIPTTPANAQADSHLTTGEVIWVEGDANLSGVTVGCEVAVTGSNVCPESQTIPTIVIVNGNLTVTGTSKFYGILYTTGTLTLSGATTVTGAAISATDIQSNVGGSLDVWYNSDVLKALGTSGNISPSSGSWTDLQP